MNTRKIHKNDISLGHIKNLFTMDTLHGFIFYNKDLYEDHLYVYDAIYAGVVKWQTRMA